MNKVITILIVIALTAVTAIAKEKSYQPENYSYMRGIEQFSEQNYADALEWFNKEIKEHPDNGYAYWFISAIKLIQDEYGEALSAANAALRKVTKKDKETISSIYQTRAKIHIALTDTIEALNDYALAIKADSKDADALDGRGDLLYFMGRYDDSDADFNKALEIENARRYSTMGLGRNNAARKNWDAAIEQYSRVIKMYPDYSSGYSFRAEAYIAKEMWNEATEDILKALDIDGDNKAFSLMRDLKDEARDAMKVRLKIKSNKDKKNGVWQYYLGIMAYDEDEYIEAISCYQKSFEIEADPVLMFYISGCYMDMGDYRSALDAIDQAMQMKDDDTDYMLRRANILSTLKRYDDAIEQINKYIAADAEDANGYLAKAEYEYAKKDYASAIEDYTTVTVLAPEYMPTYLKRGQAYTAIDKKDLAVKDFERILETDTVQGSVIRGYALIRLGRNEEARDYIGKILEADSTDNNYNVACLYSLLGDADSAIVYLRKSLDRDISAFVHMQDDRDFDNICETEAYKAIVDEYTEKLNAAKPTAVKVVDAVDDADGETETSEIPFTKSEGVTKVKCTINDLPLSFIFDTGASLVSMSSVEATFMYKNGYITKEDICGTAAFTDANGDISEGTIINLRKIKFGEFELTNVRASVVHNQVAPLLLGQSVLGRLGRITIDNKRLCLIITHKKSTK